jgi:hypothetical protein
MIYFIKLLIKRDKYYLDSILWSLRYYWNNSIGEYEHHQDYALNNLLIKKYRKKYPIFSWFIDFFYELCHPVNNDKFTYKPNPDEIAWRNRYPS